MSNENRKIRENSLEKVKANFIKKPNRLRWIGGIKFSHHRSGKINILFSEETKFPADLEIRMMDRIVDTAPITILDLKYW